MIALDRGPSRVKDLDSEFGELMEDARYGVLAVDQQDCIFFANRRMEAMCGSSLAELMHRPIEVLVPRSPRAVHRRKWVEYQAIGAPVRPMGTNLDIRFQTSGWIRVPRRCRPDPYGYPNRRTDGDRRGQLSKRLPKPLDRAAGPSRRNPIDRPYRR